MPGPTGPAGAAGATGPPGPGVPTGGTTGQVLAKINATNYNTQWVAPTGGGSDLSDLGFWVDSAYGDGVTDATTHIQSVLDAAAVAGGVVNIPAGNYLISATLNITASNIAVVGSAGQGTTKLVAASSMTGSSPLFTIGVASFGTDRALTANAVPGNVSVTMSSGDASSFAVGNYVLLKSLKPIDNEDANKFAGEIHQVTAVSGTTVSIDDVVYDTYTTAQTAALTAVTFLKNITLRGFTAYSTAASSTLTTGFVHCRYIDNLTIDNVEVGPAFHSLQLRSCINVRVAACYIHDMAESGANLRYGVWVCAACRNVTIQDCRFARTRHAVTTGGSTGTNNNGVIRNLIVSGCTSLEAQSAHYDCHEPTEGVTFSSNTAIGGDSEVADQAVIGIQMRGRNVTLIGNVIRAIPGRGIMIHGGVANGVAIVGNTISGITPSKAGTGTADGTGIYFDTGGASRHIISGNTIFDCYSRAISASGANNDVVVTGNVIENAPNQGSGATIFASQLFPLGGQRQPHHLSGPTAATVRYVRQLEHHRQQLPGHRNAHASVGAAQLRGPQQPRAQSDSALCHRQHLRVHHDHQSERQHADRHAHRQRHDVDHADHQPATGRRDDIGVHPRWGGQLHCHLAGNCQLARWHSPDDHASSRCCLSSTFDLDRGDLAGVGIERYHNDELPAPRLSSI